MVIAFLLQICNFLSKCRVYDCVCTLFALNLPMEGPSIVILKEQAQIFKGKQLLRVEGNSKIDQQKLLHQTIMDFKSWGKHFIICFPEFSLRVHFLMFGSYRINE